MAKSEVMGNPRAVQTVPGLALPALWRLKGLSMRTTVVLLLSCSLSFAGDYADSLPRAATDSLQSVQLSLLLNRSEAVDNQIREMNGTIKKILAGSPSCDQVSILRESCRNLFLEKIALDQDLMGQKWTMRKIDHSVTIGDARKQVIKDNARGQHYADSVHVMRKNQETLFAAFYLRSVIDRYVQKRDG